jgi:hypothetical protein
MAEGLIVIGMTGIIVGGVGMLAAAGAREAKREDEESKGEEVPKIDIEIVRNSERWLYSHVCTREEWEKRRIRRKYLENQFIDEFPELSIREREKLSSKIVEVEVEW